VPADSKFLSRDPITGSYDLTKSQANSVMASPLKIWCDRVACSLADFFFPLRLEEKTMRNVNIFLNLNKREIN
jgi:hypothetical protein